MLGFLGSLAYFLVAGMARVANLFELVSLRWAAAHIAVGCVAGLAVVFVGTHRRKGGARGDGRTRVGPARADVEALRTFDEHARDGVRRAVPLAILMYLFQREVGATRSGSSSPRT